MCDFMYVNAFLCGSCACEVLKVVALETTGFTEKRNLRVGKSNLNFSTNDIRWHPRSCFARNHFSFAIFEYWANDRP